MKKVWFVIKQIFHTIIMISVGAVIMVLLLVVACGSWWMPENDF